MTPRLEALAYRIWAYADPLGWNVTMKEIAQEMGCTQKTASAVLMVKGWTKRLRVTTPSENFAVPNALYDTTFEVSDVI